mmetsp:Transcript_13145/g.37532  ORF Transcript_13145/g.37532 Transcript_13145/m.37532 type:complete len:308 (+) Transcript_13145:115-1038(+)
MARASARLPLLALITLVACGLWSRRLLALPAAWLAQGRQGAPRSPRIALRAVKPLTSERTPIYVKCVEEYDPNDPSNEDFSTGPPSKGFRNMSEAIRPYHNNPEWMIWPDPGFARDQKICSMYTLATGMFQDINKCIRDDNEDGLRRLAPFIYELRQLLRFEVDKICTPDGRKCRPFMGKLLRGLDVPEGEVEELAGLYKEGTEFTWPAFTACQLEDSGLWPFDGNLNFEIQCNIDPKKMKVPEVFAPVCIKRFLGDSNEVLIPPQTRFRVIGAKPKERVTENEVTRDVYTVILEVVELPVPMDGKR